MFEIWRLETNGRTNVIAYANTWDDALGYARIWATKHDTPNIIIYDIEHDNEYRVVMGGWPCTCDINTFSGNVKPITNWVSPCTQ